MGELGEILVRSPHIAGGYIGSPLDREAAFITNPLRDRDADPVYRTGDLGRYLPDGRRFSSGGMTISSRSVESGG